MILTLRSFAVQTRILSKECNIIADVYVRSTAQDDVKFARHPELGATHVDTCVNVGGICNAYLKSFSGSINVDKRLRNKCAMTCFGKKVLSLGGELERGCNNVDNVILEPSPAFVTFANAHEQLLPLTKREGNSFNDTVFSRFTKVKM